MKKYFKQFALVAILISSIGACSTGPKPLEKTRCNAEEFSHAVTMDHFLVNKVRVADMRVIRKKNGRLEAHARLRNESKEYLIIQYKIQFKDKTGKYLDDATNWKTVLLNKHHSFVCNHISLSKKANDFILKIRNGEK